MRGGEGAEGEGGVRGGVRGGVSRGGERGGGRRTAGTNLHNYLSLMGCVHLN